MWINRNYLNKRQREKKPEHSYKELWENIKLLTMSPRLPAGKEKIRQKK